MIEEPIGLGYRHDVGLDRIVWEADYPHADTPWPHTQEVVDSMFRNVPKAEVDAILFGDAEKLFNWKCAELERTPGVLAAA